MKSIKNILSNQTLVSKDVNVTLVAIKNNDNQVLFANKITKDFLNYNKSFKISYIGNDMPIINILNELNINNIFKGNFLDNDKYSFDDIEKIHGDINYVDCEGKNNNIKMSLDINKTIEENLQSKLDSNYISDINVSLIIELKNIDDIFSGAIGFGIYSKDLNVIINKSEKNGFFRSRRHTFREVIETYKQNESLNYESQVYALDNFSIDDFESIVITIYGLTPKANPLAIVKKELISSFVLPKENLDMSYFELINKFNIKNQKIYIYINCVISSVENIKVKRTFNWNVKFDILDSNKNSIQNKFAYRNIINDQKVYFAKIRLTLDKAYIKYKAFNNNINSTLYLDSPLKNNDLFNKRLLKTNSKKEFVRYDLKISLIQTCIELLDKLNTNEKEIFVEDVDINKSLNDILSEKNIKAYQVLNLGVNVIFK